MNIYWGAAVIQIVALLTLVFAWWLLEGVSNNRIDQAMIRAAFLQSENNGLDRAAKLVQQLMDRLSNEVDADLTLGEVLDELEQLKRKIEQS